MFDLGTTNFYIAVPSMPRREFESYSTRLFDELDEYVNRALTLPDYSLVLEVEEGSVNGVGKIAINLGALYMGIGAYGSLISSIQTIRDQVVTVSDFLAEKAGIQFEATGIKPKIQKHNGSLGRLQRLFLKVQRGEITAEQA